MARYFDGVDDGIVSSQGVYIQSYNWLVSVWFRTSVASGKKIIGAEGASGNTKLLITAHPTSLCWH
jgi:hypothetical protein